MIDELTSDDVHEERVIIKIEDAEKMAEHLVKHGCEFSQTRVQQDTYLKQPEHEVLKIIETEDELRLMRLHENNGKYDVVRVRAITTKDRDDLVSYYGVRETVEQTHERYTHDDVSVSLVTNNKGSFLILQAEHLTADIFDALDIKNPLK